MQNCQKQLAPRYRNALPPKSAHDRITAYLAAMTPGSVLTSNYMAMCDVFAGDAVRSARCRACKGLGGIDGDPNKIALWQEQLLKPDVTPARARDLRGKISKERECRICRGTGYRDRNLSREQADDIFTTVRCGKCLGSGEIDNEEEEDTCPRCGGDACVVPQTVRPTGSSRHGWLPPGATNVAGGSDGTWVQLPHGRTQTVPAWSPPDPPFHEDSVLEDQNDEFAQTGAVLRELAEADGTAAEAAALYHAPEADQWAKHPWGRSFVLWTMTAGGRALGERYLKRRELKGAGHLVMPLQRIAVEREEESRSSTPDVFRQAMLRKADAEARILEARMQAAIADAEARLA